MIFYLKFPHPCLVVDLKQKKNKKKRKEKKRKEKYNPTISQKREKHGFPHDKCSIMSSQLVKDEGLKNCRRVSYFVKGFIVL